MTQRIKMTFAPVGGTAAGLGRANGRTLIVDRPEGRAGGQGLGFNGAELLAGAIGGCFWNDLHYMADAAGLSVTVDHVEAEVELAGNPPRIVRAWVTARLTGAPDDALEQLFEAAREGSTVASSLVPAIPISFERQA